VAPVTRTVFPMSENISGIGRQGFRFWGLGVRREFTKFTISD